MEFKFRSIDNVKPSTTPHSLSPITYLPDRSLPMHGGFSGFQLPLTAEAALQRELEKEQIRWEILRRRELEEEVRRELAMERELGFSIQRPLNIHGLMSQWSNKTVMNHTAVGHIGTSQPPLILTPAEINPSPEISDKGKVILLAKPDPDLFNAKRKATTPPVSETEPLAFGLKKKPKEEWSCALCEIKATSESGLNAHLNGKKHKAMKAGQKWKIAESNKKSGKNEMAAKTVVTTTKLGVDAKKDQQLLQPCKALEVKNVNVVDKGVTENKKDEQLVEMVADSATESKNEKFMAMMVDKSITESKNVKKLVEVADNGVSVLKSKNENKLVEMMVYNVVRKFENGELLVGKSQSVGPLESKKDAAIEEAGKISALTKRRKVERLWCEICQISTFSRTIMEGHIKGKKHLKKKKKFGQNIVSPPSTLSVSQKAPGLIKDAETVNKETD